METLETGLIFFSLPFSSMDAWVKGVFKRDLKLSYAVAPDPTTLEKWVKTNPQIRAYLGL